MDQPAMLSIRDRLQAIEDELVAADLDEFMVACDAGTFIWRTVERAQHGEEPPLARAVRPAAPAAHGGARSLNVSRKRGSSASFGRAGQ